MDHDDDYYDEEPPLALAGALDSKGKALFGTPGPGTYYPPTSFRPRASKLHPGDDDSGRQIYRSAPAFSLAAEHKEPKPTTDVPGPDAYGVPKNTETKTAAARATFGTADRSHESKRFLSDALSADAPKDTPGPGLYKIRQGKGYQKTMGDAPTWKFGTSLQRVDEFAPAKLAGKSKTHLYDLPDEWNKRDGTSNAVFAPMGRMDRGMQRTRDEGANMYISRAHCETQRDPQQEFAPAPGWYHLEDIEQLSKHSKNVRVTFGKGPRSTQAKPNYMYVSRAFEEFGVTSPGPGYPPKDVGKKVGPVFGTGPKTYDPELGGNKGGPYISRLHTRTVRGADSPGPSHYTPEEIKLGEEIKIGKGQRTDITAGVDTKAPGPGAYQPKKDRGYYQYSQNGSYSMAANLRTDFTQMAGNRDGPGPGEYLTNVGIAKPHPGKKRAPGWKMGVRTAELKDADKVPGPGAYKEQTTEDVGRKTGYSFGLKEKVPTRSRNGQPPRYRGAGSDAECLGIDSPGPKYGVREAPRNAPGYESKNFKFGTSARVNEKMFISKIHAENGIRADAPGPGAYEPTQESTSKFKKRGGCSFGTAPRPSLANVKF